MAKPAPEAKRQLLPLPDNTRVFAVHTAKKPANMRRSFLHPATGLRQELPDSLDQLAPAERHALNLVIAYCINKEHVADNLYQLPVI